jgi:hypothetical protein
MLMRLRDEERGVAMIIAVSVAFVVLILSTVVVAQSIHSLESSGYDRERLMSINAAEAGTNQWYAYLQSTPALSMAADAGCSASGTLSIAQTVQSGPSAAAFNAVGTFYAADGTTTMSCKTFTDTNYPSFVKVRSTGTINGSPNRTLETYVRLTPNYGGFGAAILAVNGATISNSFTVNGNAGNDGDMYFLNGNVKIQNSPVVAGNVYVPKGTLQIENSVTVKGNAWANGNITLQNTATIQGDALSSTGNISGSGTINDDATAGGTVNTSGLTIGGIVTSNVSMPAVPTQTFPVIGYTATNWTAIGYSIIDSAIYGSQPPGTNCQKAYSWLRTAWNEVTYPNIVLRITGPACTFAPGNDTISIKGNVAVITDWGFNLSKSDWNGTPGSVKKLHFISTAPAASCPASGFTTTKDITVANNTNFNAQTNVFFYTPCTATMMNQQAFIGQVLATNVDIRNQFKMSYKPVLVPGITGLTGFKQDISYIHE